MRSWKETKHPEPGEGPLDLSTSFRSGLDSGEGAGSTDLDDVRMEELSQTADSKAPPPTATNYLKPYRKGQLYGERNPWAAFKFWAFDQEQASRFGSKVFRHYKPGFTLQTLEELRSGQYETIFDRSGTIAGSIGPASTDDQYQEWLEKLTTHTPVNAKLKVAGHELEVKVYPVSFKPPIAKIIIRTPRVIYPLEATCIRREICQEAIHYEINVNILEQA